MCDCKVVFTVAQSGFNVLEKIKFTHEIDYCPLHASAPKLLSACKTAALLLEDEPTLRKSSEFELIKTAIAKAEGR